MPNRDAVFYCAGNRAHLRRGKLYGRPIRHIWNAILLQERETHGAAIPHIKLAVGSQSASTAMLP